MLTVDGSEKTQLVPQKQRKNTCMTIILLLTIITVGGGVYHGMINGGHVIDTAYGQASVPLVRNETAKLLASDGANYDWFGHSVSVYNNTAVIGAIFDGDNGFRSGSAYVFEKNSTGHWTQKEKLLASDGEADDRFSYSVSVYNSTAVIGAVFDNDNGLESGSAYVFEKNSTGHWTQKEKLLASDSAAGDRFGYSVSVYNSTAVIGAVLDNDNGLESGSAYVFEKNSTGHWTQKEKLLASDGEADDWFGYSVSVYNNTAVIGVYRDDDNDSNSGSAYVFEKNSTGHWTQKEKLLASDSAAGDWFGYSVSVYNSTAVIGAVLDNDNGLKSGSAYVFEKNSTGHWTQKEKLLASDSAADDYFGISVSVYNNTAVIGAYRDDDNGLESGSAYVFEKNSTGHWTQKEKLLASDGEASGIFGNSVSVYNSTAVIGAAYHDDNGPNSGSAYVFTILQAPTANAGADQTVSEGTTDIQLNGTGSADPNGDAITYLWSQTQGPTVTLSSSTSASPTFDAPAVNSEQTLTFSLTVNDGTEDSTPDTVDITIQNTINESPTANAGADQTVSEGGITVTLDGTGSADPNGDAITYLWSQNEDNAFEVDLSSSTSESPMFTTPAVNSEQTLTFSLVVNDGTEDSTPDTVDITIQNTINESPTANAGADQTVSEGTTDIQLNGSATDPDTDDTITYLWSQTQGPTVTLSSSTSASPTFDAPAVNSEQTLTFSLTVNDGTEDSTPDTVDITIQNTINESPTANAGADQTVSEGGITVTLDGTGSADPNGDAITYLWSQNEDNAFEVDLSSSTSESPMFTTPAVNSEQTLTFSLVVNDGTEDSTPDTVDITIQNTINESPTANAGADQTVSEGTTDIQLNGSATDPDTDDTITYLWSQTQGPTVTLSSSTSASPTFDAPAVNSEQTLTFSLTVNDGTEDSTPDTVDITIQNTINESPTANAGADQTVSEGGITVTLDGTGSADPNGDAITYLWSQNEDNAFDSHL